MHVPLSIIILLLLSIIFLMEENIIRDRRVYLLGISRGTGATFSLCLISLERETYLLLPKYLRSPTIPHTTDSCSFISISAVIEKREAKSRTGEIITAYHRATHRRWTDCRQIDRLRQVNDGQTTRRPFIHHRLDISHRRNHHQHHTIHRLP